jgi:hypothetical protein
MPRGGPEDIRRGDQKCINHLRGLPKYHRKVGGTLHMCSIFSDKICQAKRQTDA